MEPSIGKQPSHIYPTFVGIQHLQLAPTGSPDKAFSCLLSHCGTSAGFLFHVCGCCISIFLPALGSTGITPLHCYYGGSDFPASDHLCKDLPSYFVTPSNHSVLNHPMTSSQVGVGIAPLAHIFILIHGESPTLEDFTIRSQVRHVIEPNQVHFITDWLFIFSCSPPRLLATQLLSINGKQHLATEGLAHS